METINQMYLSNAHSNNVFLVMFFCSIIILLSSLFTIVVLEFSDKEYIGYIGLWIGLCCLLSSCMYSSIQTITKEQIYTEYLKEKEKLNGNQEEINKLNNFMIVKQYL